MPTKDHTTSTPAINPQNPTTWLKPDEPLIGADGRDWSWCYVWHKDIEGSLGYKVGADGSVWSRWKKDNGQVSCLSDEWHRLSGSTRKGYLQVTIRDRNGAWTSKPVHKLVMEAFVSKRPRGLQCRHLNGIRTDARLSNLCWGTPKSNGQDKVRHGTNRPGSECHLAKLDDNKVREIRRLRREGMSIAAIGRRFGVSDVNVSYVCLRRTWTHVPD